MLLRPSYLNQIRPFIGTDIIKVLVGVRRSGKSTILKMIRDELLRNGSPEENLLSINLESAQYMDVTDAKALVDLVRLHAPERGRFHIFLDEVQEVNGWEKAVRSFLVDYDADIYLTGSNANLLSSDLATHITGRYVTVNVYPFSFAEFYRGLNQTHLAQYGTEMNVDTAFTRYVQQGGFPFQMALDFHPESTLKYLKDLFSTILLRDVVEHASIRDVDQLQRIVTYAISEVGHLLTPKRIADYLKSDRRSTRQETVANYLNSAEDAFLLRRAKREDVIGKKHLQFNHKYYVIDQGLRQAIGLRNRDAIDQILENIVFVELLRRKYDVTVGRVGEREIDFIARKDGNKEYFQVTYLLASPDTVDREFGVLESISDNYPKYVLSMDPFPTTRAGIRGMNLVEWLLE